MSFAAAVVAVAACLLLAVCLRVPSLALASFRRAGAALRDLRDPALGERERERVVRGHALGLFAGFLRLAAAGAAAVGLPLGGVALLAAAGAVDFDAVVAWTVNPGLLLGAGVVAAVAARWSARTRP